MNRYCRKLNSRSARRARLAQFQLLEPRQLLAADPIAAGQPVIISEFSADTTNTLLTRTRASEGSDFTGRSESPDWVELLNLSNATVDLSGAGGACRPRDRPRQPVYAGEELDGERRLAGAGGCRKHEAERPRILTQRFGPVP